MELFEQTFTDIRNYIEGKKCQSWTVTQRKILWPSGKGRNVVLSDEMAVELGNPQMNSVSCLIWTGKPDLVIDGKISLVGPDINESKGKSLPFGKIVLVGVSEFDEESAYDKYKAVSQYQREWSRISHDALQKGFSFEVLGSALREEYLKKSFVRAVEFLFVTSSGEDVSQLQEITKNVGRTISALNKMLNEIDPDCDECEYNDVCDEVDELKGMRKSRKEKTVNSNG